MAALAAAHGPDDLSLISGIGPVYDKKLHELGFTTFAQIAALDAAGVADLEGKLQIGEKIEHEQWVAQAKELMGGKAPRAKVDQAKKAGGEKAVKK